jgi:hypothetical protein
MAMPSPLIKETLGFVPRLGRYDGVINIDWADRSSSERVAKELHEGMPSIGLFSAQKRWDCFITICDRLDEMIVDQKISMNDALLAVLILRRQSDRFSKAGKTFSKLMGLADGKGFLRESPNSPIEQMLPSVARSYFIMIRALAYSAGLIK